MHLRQFGLWVCYTAIFIVCFCIGGALYVAHTVVIDMDVLENADRGIASILLDDEGNELARFQLDRREPVELGQLPQHLIDAFLTAEDWYFFSHPGVSYRGILRSLWVNVVSGRYVQGASTITQQLVKLLFFDARKTFSRKMKEQVCAILIEQRFTKHQILEAYLNNVCFGCGIYGVQAASQRFWGIDAFQLSCEQAALLAGIVRSPGRYCPLVYPLSAQRIRNVVLRSMHTRGFLDAQELARALYAPLDIVASKKQQCAPHYVELLRGFLEKEVGKRALYTDGLVIQTTLDRRMQQVADISFYKQCVSLHKTLGPDIEGGLISIAVETGEVKALVGGVDFDQSQWNRATQARRQMGSIIKPLLFSAALDHGYSFADVEIDEPIEMSFPTGVWRPHNYDHQFRGPITLAYALSHSNNMVAIKTLLAVGAQHLVELLQEAGVSGPFHTYPSLALGCIDATLYEAVGMFNIFAHDGVYVEPHYIRWIKNRWGQKIYRSDIQSRRVISSTRASQVAKVLELGLKRIKPFFAQQWLDVPAMSKTGTTNDARTCWFVGSTPSYTTAVYIGFDDGRPMGQNVFPIHTAFPIWLAYHHAIGSPKQHFSYDPHLREIVIDEKTGQEVCSTDARAISIFA